jgi:hypothetical protein
MGDREADLGGFGVMVRRDFGYSRPEALDGAYGLDGGDVIDLLGRRCAEQLAGHGIGADGNRAGCPSGFSDLPDHLEPDRPLR